MADLPRGRIETRDQKRLVAIPAEWLEQLVGHARAAADTMGVALGESLDSDVHAVLDAWSEASPEDVAYALSAALASRGLGTVEFEHWGDVLSLVWRDPPGSGDAIAELFAATAARLVRGLTGIELSGAAVGREGTSLRVLLASSDVCDDARERVRRGDSFAEIVAHLEPRGDCT